MIENHKETPTHYKVKPHLIDRADGVMGHFCIVRSSNNQYYEYWNEDNGWCSDATVFIGRELANSKLKEFTTMVGEEVIIKRDRVEVLLRELAKVLDRQPTITQVKLRFTKDKITIIPLCKEIEILR